MKKFFMLCAVCCMCLCLFGCGKKDNVDDVDVNNMSDEQIVDKLVSTNNWLTSVWNDGICDISHYLNSGTNSVGEAMDVEFVLQILNDKYAQKDEQLKFVNSLDDTKYSLIKTSFIKAIEQADIIVEKVNKDIPKPNTTTDYQENITSFSQYQSTFYDKVMDLYFAQ